MIKCRGHNDCCQPESSITWNDLCHKLRAKDLKLTTPRRSMLEVLRAFHHPISPQELHCKLPPNICDLATVYRSMHLLESKDIVRRYDFGDGIVRFELVREDHQAHHHHLVCTRCAGVVEIHECVVQDIEERLASRHGFKAVNHRLEFFGICPQCQ